MLDSDLLTFIRSSFRSVWAVELVLLLRKQAPAKLAPEQISRELRATTSLVASCIEQLQAAGILAVEDDRSVRYAPASSLIDHLCASLEAAYRERPVAVITAIMSSPNDRLKTLADAFRFKDKEKDE